MDKQFKKDLSLKRKYLRDENRKWTDALTPVPRESWPKLEGKGVLINVLRAKDFCVQVYEEKDGMTRLSICRTVLNRHGEFDDGIDWEELQQIKAEAGYAEHEAVEVFPPETDIVNVANFRHIWIFPAGQRLAFSWRK